MAKRKKDAPTLETWTQVDETLGRLRSIEDDRLALELQMNGEITRIREKYEPVLKRMTSAEKCFRADVEAFCEAHKDDCFKDPRTLERMHYLLGFRLAPQSVEPLSREWTMKRILDAVVEVFKTRFIRYTPALNKERILEDYRAGKVSDADLASAGLRIDQRDHFYIERKEDAAPAIPTAEESAA